MQTALLVLVVWTLLAALAVAAAAVLLAGSKRWERSARTEARRQAEVCAEPALRRVA